MTRTEFAIDRAKRVADAYIEGTKRISACVAEAPLTPDRMAAAMVMSAELERRVRDISQEAPSEELQRAWAREEGL